jgi:CHAD domain-containing protein
MREYARAQTATLLRRVAFQLNRAGRHTDHESVHDLRVAIRRLSRCLRMFGPLYPNRYWKKIRRELAALMDSAAAVRDRDVALELLRQSGISPRATILTHLTMERRRAAGDLSLEIRRWKSHNLSAKWRNRLEL